MHESSLPFPGHNSRFPAFDDPDELADYVLNRIDRIVADCEAQTKPLEVDPARGELFRLFVMAEAAGLVQEDAQPDLSADGVCQSLAAQWGLKDAAEMSFRAQEKLGDPYLTKMRSLWSVMRMWMEWTYAWQRWAEFHDASGRTRPPSPAAPDQTD